MGRAGVRSTAENRNAEERSRLYWGHEGACLTEQVENYGLPCYPEYGNKRPEGFDPGLERNAWLEYEWDTCLEFCMMALEAHRYCGMDISRYVPMIRSCLRFFDEHYQYLANLRRCFDRNEFINLRFTNNDIQRLEKFQDKELFGIQIGQEYTSSTYTDIGYLFLLTDLTDHNQPQIKVRTWQPNEVEMDKLYHAGYFYDN